LNYSLVMNTAPGKLLAMLAISLFAGSQSLAQSLTAVAVPSAIADAGGSGSTGTPYAVFVRIQGWTNGAGGQAYVKVYSGTNNEYMWNGTAWSNATAYATSCPLVTIDASGNWSGWIYAKHNSSLGATASVRAAKSSATSTNITSASKSFTILNMQNAGGWMVRTTSPAVNKGILAYSGGVVVGTYRTEENGIAEGYSYSAGGFKVAVPAGIVDSLVTLNDDGSRDQVFSGPWSVTAGQETDASTTAGGVGKGLVKISPSTMSSGVSHILTLKVLGETPYVITNTRVRIPPAWSWSRSTNDIAVLSGTPPAITVSGDTISLSGMALGGADSLTLTVSNVTPPDTTASFSIIGFTGTHPDSIYAISTQPSVFVYGVPLAISAVKTNDAFGVPLRNNTLVTLRGVVTVANEFGGPGYIQDNSGGIAVFGSTFSSAVAIGDEVIVSGLLQPFSGLCEIVNPVLHSIVTTGNLVDPVVVTASQIENDGSGGVEVYEGRLIRINGVSVTGSGTWSANTNYSIFDATDTTQLRIDNNTILVGGAIPVSACDIMGVVGQFIGSSPYIGGYQIMPRMTSDIISSGPVIATMPVESNLAHSSFTVFWTTARAGTSGVKYGLTTGHELGIVSPDTLLGTTHQVSLHGLSAATVYHVQAFSSSGTDTSWASDLIASTASSAAATGAINVYFNKSVTPSVVTTPPAAGNQNLVTLLATRINNARRSIDAALYSLSGTPGPGTDLANALIAAKGRGVNVRVICEQDNRSTSPLNALASAGIPLITDSYDAANAGAGLMHNKFAVIDGRGGAPDSVWVWTGSWNPTDPGTNDDYQNSIEIQDPALAGAYELEFNEMWGSATQAPNATASRFGARKTDNTPHRFSIGGREVELYFSPSDKTTSHLVTALGSATHSIQFALLTFTRDDLAKVLVARAAAGVTIHGLMDNRTDTGSEYDYLAGQGVDMHLKTGSGLLHHKYAILDAGWAGTTPMVITGSHNWSSSAENSNNENTLIIRDAALANFYFQEFAARYYQFGGTDTLAVSVEADESQRPAAWALFQNYPNPFNPTTVVSCQVPVASSIRLVVYDLLGREVAVLMDGRKPAGAYTVQFNATGLASGVYFVRLQSGEFTLVRSMMLLR
jgi:phosphatidylserine/phosphatidylglycerophosphate/cardiolipin synthase-like enzyme